MGISIIMPTYNRLALLREAIASVLSQIYQEWELLISDDGSTDGSREYLSSLSEPRIRFWLQPAHLGQFGNLNFLFSQAKYPVAQILCDDDLFADSDSLSRLHAMWAKLPPDTGFLRVNHSLDANSELSRFEGSILPETVRPEQSDLLLGTFGSITGSISNVSARVAAVKEAGMFRPDMHYAGDFEFWSRLGRLYPWVISKERIVDVRRHEGQVGATQNTKGEYMWQLRAILEPMYSNLVRQGHSATLLRLLFAINYVAQHRWIGVKNLIARRDPRYMRSVTSELDRANFSLGTVLNWLVFVVSLRGKLFRIPLAKRLVEEKV